MPKNFADLHRLSKIILILFERIRSNFQRVKRAIKHNFTSAGFFCCCSTYIVQFRFVNAPLTLGSGSIELNLAFYFQIL